MATHQIGTVKTVVSVEYSDLEELVQKVYGPSIPELENYSFIDWEECCNDSSHTFTVENKLDEYEQEDWNNREFMYNNGMILNKLCADGYIISGNYCIEVCW